MATRGGAQAPSLQQRNINVFLKPGQLDGKRQVGDAEGQEDGGGQEAPADASGDGQAQAPST
eukprot:5583151-Heterocapsa_arctica.AAC.1